MGLLDKGSLALLLPGSVIAVAEIGAGNLRPRTLDPPLRALHARLGLVLVMAIAIPWYWLAVLRNPGFFWDSVVNQQLLRFFNEELPRDFVPDSLGFSWAMFLVRTLPWSALLPAALLHGWRDVNRRATLRLPVAWMAVVLAVFSLSPARLEHYSLPALPAVALVVGVFLADGAAGRARVGREWSVTPLAAGAFSALACATRDPSLLIARLDPTLSGYGLSPLLRAGAVTAAGSRVSTVPELCPNCAPAQQLAPTPGERLFGEAGPVEPPGEDGEGENQDEQQARCHPTATFFRRARPAGSARTRRPARARTADETPSTCSRRSSRA